MNRAMKALEATTTLSEAKEIARDMRQTAITVERRYGSDHHITKTFNDRYLDFVDEMVFKYS